MTDKQWDTFFGIMDQIIKDNSLGATWQERAMAVQREAEARDSSGSLEEFGSWCSYITEGG